MFVFMFLWQSSAQFRDQPIMLIFYLLAMLCCSAYKVYLLCSILCSRIRIVLSLLSLFIYKFAWISHYSRQCTKTGLLGCVYKCHQIMLYVLLKNNCLIRVYQSFVAIFKKIFSIVLVLCLMLSVTYYAQNYADIIGWSLVHIIAMSPCLQYKFTALRKNLTISTNLYWES